LWTEKGAQMTYAIEACLLLVSGVYFNTSVLPMWLQPFTYISPATYALRGIRDVLLGHPSGAALANALIPLTIIGLITIPMGVWLFAWAERYAKRTGRLKRTG